jgi:carbon storage regulator
MGLPPLLVLYHRHNITSAVILTTQAFIYEGVPMLVLRRRQGEAIVLNTVIVIRVLSIEGDRVKLGIDAPPDVIVVREELLDEPATSYKELPGGTNYRSSEEDNE